MKELFPHLKGLKGGEKQAWVNANLDLVALLNDHLGFEDTRKVLNMKADTLSRALVRAERHHRPAITRADKALNKATAVESQVYDLQSEVNRQVDEFEVHASNDQERWEYLAQFFELQSRANAMMAELLKKVGEAADFSHSTLRNRYVVRTNSKSAQLPRESHGRLLDFSGQGRLALPRPGVKRNPKHQGRHHTSQRLRRRRRRWPGA